MGQINIRRMITISALFSLVLYFILTWINVLQDPDQRTGSDFMGVYVFGRITQTTGIQHLYDIKEHQKVEEQVVGHPVKAIFYTHLPFMAPLAAAIVQDDYIVSFQRWAFFLLLLNALSVYLLVNLVELQRFTRENAWILILGVFFFDPTFSGFLNGQDTALLLLGTAIWAWGVFSEKYFLAGLGLSLATVRPQVALFLALPFLFKHRKVLLGFVLGASILAIISMILLKVNGVFQFIESLRYIERTIWVEPHSFDMPTLSGIIRRNFTVTNIPLVKGIVWAGYLLGIVMFCIWWYKSGEIQEKHIGLISLAAIFFLPYAHYHELTLVLLPIFCVLRMLEKHTILAQYYMAILPLVVSWLSTLGFIGSGAMKFPIVFFIMGSLAYLLLTDGKIVTRLSQATAAK